MKTTTGWCLGCRSEAERKPTRINTHKFRQLIDGKVCADCHQLLPKPVNKSTMQQVIILTQNVVSPKIGKYRRVNYKDDLLKEEAQLIEAFTKFKDEGIGKYWVKPLA